MIQTELEQKLPPSCDGLSYSRHVWLGSLHRIIMNSDYNKTKNWQLDYCPFTQLIHETAIMIIDRSFACFQYSLSLGGFHEVQHSAKDVMIPCGTGATQCVAFSLLQMQLGLSIFTTQQLCRDAASAHLEVLTDLLSSFQLVVIS